jgi:hypothetical protein
MLIHGFVKECDSCAQEWNGHGAHVVAQGATGRWCVVLHVCPNCTDMTGVISHMDARLRIEDELIGWADF